MMLLQKIDLANIVDPLAPVRAQIDPASLQELADSIRELGLIQPIVVRPAGEKFEVVAGHRRLMACRMLDLPAVECLVRENAGEADVTAERLHENLIRKDMTPVEEAVVYAELFEKYGDLERVAAMAHRSLAVVERRLALLAGDAAIRDALHAGEISSGVAEELNRVKDKTTRAFLLRFAVAEGATVNKVSAWRRQYVNVQLVPGQEPSAP
ncbi:MAG: ParB/RepB/Spo0J family partition protein, partial [Terriglobia bacterium]